MFTINNISKQKYGYEYVIEISGTNFIVKITSDGEILEVDHDKKTNAVCHFCNTTEERCSVMEIKYRKLLQHLIYSIVEMDKVLGKEMAGKDNNEARKKRVKKQKTYE